MKIVSPPLTSRSETRKRTLQRMHEADKPNPKGKKIHDQSAMQGSCIQVGAQQFSDRDING